MQSEYVEQITEDPYGLQYMCYVYKYDQLTHLFPTVQVISCDMRHNIYGPALQCYRLNGSRLSIQYYMCGDLHRIIWPAMIIYSADSEVSAVQHYIHGKLHNEHGPAHITFDANTVHEEFYIDDVLQKSK